jgi:hypothetical protein
MNIKLHSLIALFLVANISAGHHEGGKMHGNSAEWEIETYTSSAPDFIGDFATVVSASGDVLREGTNGWTCPSIYSNAQNGIQNCK